MGIWSSIVKHFTRSTSSGGGSSVWTKIWTSNGVTNTITTTVGKGAAAVGKGAAQAGQKIISWGSAAKVALVGGFGYVFLTGGLSKTVASTLGISEGAAQFLIWVVALILFLYIVKRIWSRISYTLLPTKSRSSSYKRRRY